MSQTDPKARPQHAARIKRLDALIDRMSRIGIGGGPLDDKTIAAIAAGLKKFNRGKR